MFRLFDETGTSYDRYNRTGAVTFAARRTDRPRFIVPNPGEITLEIDPSDSSFDKLGVDFFLLLGKDRSLFAGHPRFKERYSLGEKTIYEVIR